jgi:DNA-binding transcriptional ArsR family regulator
MAYAEALTALADPTRRTVFERLRTGPRTVGEIADGLPVSRPAVSQHLRVLESAKLVTARQEGTRRIYRVDQAGLAVLRGYFDSFWSDVLVAFRTEAAAAATTAGQAGAAASRAKPRTRTAPQARRRPPRTP